MTQFKTERIPEILGENLNPSFFLLNLNPNTASKANKEDKTTVIITWLELIIVLLLVLTLLKRGSLIKKIGN